MGVGAGLYMCDVVKKVHVRYLISWWVLVIMCNVDISQVWLENDYSLPKTGGFGGGFYPANGKQPHHNPQRAPPCVETHHATSRSLRLVQPSCVQLTLLKNLIIPCIAMGHTINKSALSRGNICNPTNTWFHAPTRVLNGNGILIASDIFAGLTTVTE